MYFIILTKIQKNEQISVIIFCIKYLIYTHMKYLKTYEAQHVNTIAKRFKGEYDKINNKLVEIELYMKDILIPLHRAVLWQNDKVVRDIHIYDTKLIMEELAARAAAGE